MPEAALPQPDTHLHAICEKVDDAHSCTKEFVRRASLATFGGCTLMIPMISMILDQRRYIRMVSATLLTVGFGMIVISILLVGISGR